MRRSSSQLRARPSSWRSRNGFEYSPAPRVELVDPLGLEELAVLLVRPAGVTVGGDDRVAIGRSRCSCELLRCHCSRNLTLPSGPLRRTTQPSIRPSRSGAEASSPGASRRTRPHHPSGRTEMTDVMDIWVNLVTSEGAAEFLGQAQFANIPGYLGSSSTEGIGTDGMLGADGRPRRRHRHRLRGDGPHRRARARGGRRAPGPVPRGPRPRRVGPADPQRAPHPQARRAPRDLDGAGHAAQQPGRDRRRAPLPRVLGLRGARDPGGDQRRHPRAAGAVTRAAPRAARGRDDRLPRPRRSSARTWAIPTRSCS